MDRVPAGTRSVAKKSEVNKISIFPAQRVGRYLLHAVNCYFHLDYSLINYLGK